MFEPDDPIDVSAYGGAGWEPRTRSLRDEIGTLWGRCGIASEWSPLRAVLLHRPGPEIEALDDPGEALMLAPLEPAAVREQHDGMAEAYRAAGVTVHYVDPAEVPPPNQMFCADLMMMTPSGAIVGRPASPVRAGEERWVARRLGDLGIPILRTVAGSGVFEGADALWVDEETVLLGRGLRTNEEGAAQVEATLAELGVRTVLADLPHASMHLMGEIRIVDRDLAFVRKGGCPWRAVQALQAAGFEICFLPSGEEARRGMADNFVVLGPRRVLMPAGNPRSQAAYEAEGAGCDYRRSAAGPAPIATPCRLGSDAPLHMTPSHRRSGTAPRSLHSSSMS
jgi:arginine deiminase